MSKDEMIEMLKISNCDVNTIIFAINAWEMGYEHAQKEQHDASSDILGWWWPSTEGQTKVC